MTKRLSGVIASMGAVCVLALLAGVAQAAPGVLPPNSNAYGKGYDELAANWTEWINSIPLSVNPLFDDTGANAAIGQSGKVWFLAGTTGGNAPVNRTVTVPTGKALFFPIVNYFWVNTPENGDDPWSPQQEAVARGVLAYFIDSGQNLVLQIDGKTIPYVYELLRATSTVGMCVLPADNLYGANPGPHECVADGFWALLPPMSAGVHTIHFEGELGLAPGFAIDVTYRIYVRRVR